MKRSDIPAMKPSRILLIALAVIILGILIFRNKGDGKTILGEDASATLSSSSVSTTPKIVPVISSRNDLGTMLENLGLKTGVELGVLKGEFARVRLSPTQLFRSATHI
jgi:hypothetical protein